MIDSNSSNTGDRLEGDGPKYRAAIAVFLVCVQHVVQSRQITWTAAANSPTNFVKISGIVGDDRYTLLKGAREEEGEKERKLRNSEALIKIVGNLE